MTGVQTCALPISERGARLTHQLLAMARTDDPGHGAGTALKRLDLATLAAAAAEQWLQASLDAGQDLGFALQPAPVQGDPLLLSELLGNLIHNAIEHAGPGAAVTVHTGLQDGQALLCVEDNGPGLPAEEHEAVWQRFRRGRASRGHGSGLGLAIVREIAHRHGAQAMLASGPGGRGLQVRITFPAA